VYVITGGKPVSIIVLVTPVVVARPVPGDHVQRLQLQLLSVALRILTGIDVRPGYKQALNVS
jgi:hypothetical protein